MSIRTERGKDLKSLRDAPIHLTGFSSPSTCIPVYVYHYIGVKALTLAGGRLCASGLILFFQALGNTEGAARRNSSPGAQMACARKTHRKGLRGGFGAKDALEAWAGELDADEALAGLRFGDVHDAAAGGEVLFSMRRDVCREGGMRISRSEPMATSKRVTKAAPLRQRFSLEVSSSKVTPRASRAAHFEAARRTEILRSERCLDTDRSAGTMGWVLVSGDPDWFGIEPHYHARTVLEKALHAFHTSPGVRAACTFRRARRRCQRHEKTSKANCFIFPQHRGVGSINFAIVAGE